MYNGTVKCTMANVHDLATAEGNGKFISYHYDMDGVRDSKTVDGVKHEYITQGGNVTLERWNDGEEKSLEFIYDNGGAPYSVIYSRGNEVDTYYYILNQQGDVIRIVDTSGKTVAEYTYNGWGEILNVSNAKDSEIGTLNPIRYRGYYYDSELNMYYLQSRYYDPVMKRMIASDDESATSASTIINNNLFSYCDNNPINRVDAGGGFWTEAIINAGISAAVYAIEMCVEGEQFSWYECGIQAFSGAVSGMKSTPVTTAISAFMTARSIYYTVQSYDLKTKEGAIACALDIATDIALDSSIDKLEESTGLAKKASRASKPKEKGSKKPDSVSKGHGKSKRVSLTSIKRKISGLRQKFSGKVKTAGVAGKKLIERAKAGIASIRNRERHILARIGLRVHLKIGKWFYKRFSRHRT